MKNSFAGNLRKIAEAAEEAKRLEAARKREAELQLLAEARRLKLAAEAEVRLKARRADQQKQRERQAHALEIERARLLHLAEKEATIRRLRDEKEAKKVSENARRDETRRLNKYKDGLVKACRHIYVQLAVAAWAGIREVQVKGVVDEYKSDLGQYGIQLKRPTQLAVAATDALDSLLKSLASLGRRAEAQNLKRISDQLYETCTCLRDTGHADIGQIASTAMERVRSEIARRIGWIEESWSTAERAISKLEADMSRLTGEIASVQAMEETAQNAIDLQKQHFGRALSRIVARVTDIGSSYTANLPPGLAPSSISVETKADALRAAFSRFVHDVDFTRFSKLEIINLVRQANGMAPYDSIPDAPGFGGLPNAKSEAHVLPISSRLRSLIEAEQDAQQEVESRLEKIEQLRAYMTDVTKLQRNVETCQLQFGKYAEVVASTLEGVDVSQLKFIDGQYVPPVLAQLSKNEPGEQSALVPAYRELMWLYSQSGRDFTEYFDIVLSELAKEGAHNVTLTVYGIDGVRRIDVGGRISLVTEIGFELLTVLFSNRGFGMSTTASSDGRNMLNIDWHKPSGRRRY